MIEGTIITKVRNPHLLHYHIFLTTCLVQTQIQTTMTSSSTFVGPANNSALSCSTTQHPGATVDDIQILIASIQASITPRIDVASTTAADNVNAPTLAWLSDVQSKLSTLQKMTKKLVNSGTLGEFVLFPKLPTGKSSQHFHLPFPSKICSYCTETGTNFPTRTTSTHLGTLP